MHNSPKLPFTHTNSKQVTRRSAHISGLTFGLTEFFMFGIWSLSFYYGAVLVEDGDCSFG